MKPLILTLLLIITGCTGDIWRGNTTTTLNLSENTIVVTGNKAYEDAYAICINNNLPNSSSGTFKNLHEYCTFAAFFTNKEPVKFMK